MVAGGDGTPPDAIVDGNDYIAFINAFNAGDALADINLDGVVDGSDYLLYFELLGADDGAPLGWAFSAASLMAASAAGMRGMSSTRY